MRRSIVTAIIAVITALAVILAWGYWTCFRMVRGCLRAALGTGRKRLSFWP